MADLLGRLSKSWRRHRVAAAPVTRRLFRCPRCGRPLFFRNSQCLGCGADVGYEPESAQMLAVADGSTGGARAMRCANASTAAACNWLVRVDGTAAIDRAPLCRSCRLTRTLPDLGVAQNAAWWSRIEQEKRQVVSTLITLQLPVRSRVSEDPARGLAFDLLRSPPEGPHIVTGHADGVITLDVEEADDAIREQRRVEMQEPYRTLLGHLRHEIGHYYWYRLVAGTRWLDGFRSAFGDERRDYAAALRDHYAGGPPQDWPKHFVSAYASAHPWEDWAESWAHYLHMIDALDTALSFGVSASAIEATFEPFDEAALFEADTDTTPASRIASFLTFVNAWVELSTAMNELARSMGQPDFYPFVLSGPAVRKLYFIHRVAGERLRRTRTATPPARRTGMAVAPAAH